MRRLLTSSILVCALAFVLFELLTLNHPKLSGDEALGAVLFRDELKTLAFWKWHSLNPVLPYIGPADMWLQALPIKIWDSLSPIYSPTWILRIFPFLFYLLGCFFLSYEASKKSKELGFITAILSLFTPIAFISARIGWGPALLLGTFFILWAEVIRMQRTLQVRWLFLGLLCGVSLEFHPTSSFGIAILFFGCMPLLLKSVRKNYFKAIFWILIFSFLAYPMLRHFPPPIAGQGNVADLRWELRALFNIITGERPFVFLFGEDPLPAFLRILYFLFVLVISFAGFKSLLSDYKKKAEAHTKRLALALTLGSIALLFFCYHGRALNTIGYERYIIVIVPGWIWLFSEFLQTVSKAKNWHIETLLSLLLFLMIFQGARFTTAIAKILPDRDPVLLAAEWLEKECPRSSCVAITENFWVYWPMRFYTQDRIDINVAGHNWRTSKKHDLFGRGTASCWFEKSREIYRGPYQNKIVFKAQDVSDGQVCFKEMK